jgi:hypothetical protein
MTAQVVMVQGPPAPHDETQTAPSREVLRRDTTRHISNIAGASRVTCFRLYHQTMVGGSCIFPVIDPHLL